MQSFWTEHFLLPGQEHPQARAVGESLEYARESLARLAGCEAFEIVFTGGGTEANNLAILGGAAHHRGGHLIVSSLEHESVAETTQSLVGTPWRVETVAVNEQGTIEPDRVADSLRSDTRMVCVQAANPVLGTLQPVREIAELCHHRGIAVHCDATQVFGKVKFEVSQLQADTVALSGHKFYGPKGTGALYIRRGYSIRPILFGESREMGIRPGAENVPGWVGLGAAAALAHRCAGDASTAMQGLRDHMIQSLRTLIDPQPIVLGESSPRLSNTLAIELPAEARRIQRTARELIFATALSAAPADEMTRCLRAIGRTEYQIGRTVRFSLGWTTSRQQIDRAVELIAEAIDAIARGR